MYKKSILKTKVLKFLMQMNREVQFNTNQNQNCWSETVKLLS